MLTISRFHELAHICVHWKIFASHFLTYCVKLVRRHRCYQIRKGCCSDRVIVKFKRE